MSPMFIRSMKKIIIIIIAIKWTIYTNDQIFTVQGPHVSLAFWIFQSAIVFDGDYAEHSEETRIASRQNVSPVWCDEKAQRRVQVNNNK